MHKVLIIDDVHSDLFPYLKRAGLTWKYLPEADYAQILHELNAAEGLVVRSRLDITSEILNLAPSLKWIARAGAGMDNIDEEECAYRGIHLINAPEGNRDAVAEQTIGMLLSLITHLPRADREVRRGIWLREENRGKELSSLTVGIIGYGNTGKAVVRRLRAFGCRILVYDKYHKPLSSGRVLSSDMASLFKEADIVSLHIPLTSETRFLVNTEWINSFSKPIYLLNLSRGKIVSLSNINEALERKKLLGFAADVLENEKLDSFDIQEKEQFDRLISHPDVLLSPHIGGWTTESYQKISRTLGRKIVSFVLNPG